MAKRSTDWCVRRRRRSNAPVGGVGRFGGGDGQIVRCGLRVEERQEHEVQRAVREVERDDLADLGVPTAHVHPAEVHQFVVRGDTIRAVVVPGDDGDGVAAGLQADQRLAEEHHGLRGRDGPVVHVAGHHHEVDPLLRAQPDEPVGERLLVVVERHRTEAAAEVPIAGVEDAHEGSGGGRTTGAATCRDALNAITPQGCDEVADTPLPPSSGRVRNDPGGPSSSGRQTARSGVSSRQEATTPDRCRACTGRTAPCRRRRRPRRSRKDVRT